MKRKPYRTQDLRDAEVEARRLSELVNRKYLARAEYHASIRAINRLEPAAHILPPINEFRQYGPVVLKKGSWEKDFDSPWHILTTFEHSFKDDEHYYDLMAFAGSCKDPFCDKDCPLHLDTRFDKPVVKLLIEEKSGPAIARITITCPLPPKIDNHLRNKGIIRVEHYSYSGSSGVNTLINCPT